MSASTRSRSEQHQQLVGTLRALCSAIQLQLSVAATVLASVSDAVAASDKEFTANRQRLLVSQLRL